jgi:hypothetical protein
MNDDRIRTTAAEYVYGHLILAMNPSSPHEVRRFGILVAAVLSDTDSLYRRRMREIGLSALADLGWSASQNGVKAAAAEDGLPVSRVTP